NDDYITYYKNNSVVKQFYINHILRENTNFYNFNFRYIYHQKKIIILERARDIVFTFDENNNQLQRADFLGLNNNSSKAKKTIELNDIRKDKEQNIWILTYSGLYGYNKQLKAIYQDAEGKPLALFADKPISDVIQDEEGNSWVSTLSDGIFIIPNKNLIFFDQNLPKLEDKHIYKITKDNKGNLLLGMYNGKVKVLNSRSQKIVKEFITNNRKEIECIFFDKKNNKVLVASGSSYAFDNQNNSISVLSAAAAAKSFALKDNILFSAGPEGACATPYLLESSQIPIMQFYLSRYTKLIDLPNRSYFLPYITRGRVVFAEEEKNNVWLGYAKGLYLLKNDSILKPYKWKDSLDIFAKVFAQKKDSLFVGTLTQGFFILKDEKIIQQVDKSKGLPSNFCTDLAIEGNYLWIATDKGLAKYNLRTQKLEVFNRQDGFISEQINGIAIVDKNIWIASPKGLMKMPLNMTSRNIKPPKIYLKNIDVWEKSLRLKSLYQLDYTQNNLKINFQGIAYRSKGAFYYKYKMIGIDTSWIFTASENNFARYPSLPPGSYEFQVKAINEDGIESEGTAVLQIEIASPFWRKWWFLLMITLLIMGLTFLIFWLRFRQIAKKNLIEKRLRESQLAAIKLQMNPHFIFNALNSIQEFILLNEKKLANEFLGKFADLMRLTLDMSSEEMISLKDELQMLQLYLELEAIRFENLVYHIETNENLSLSVLIPPMLIQPCVENALKHGLLHKTEQRNLWIRFYQQENNLICEVEDNGVGRQKSMEINLQKYKKHKSFATKATLKRLDLLNEGRKQPIKSEIIDLYDAHHKALGTKVIIRIPLSTQQK
ncbi:MAG: histidine kinase, partial [Thermonemataceae bacterium]|nr:histidine kinase [Thermonemataceae bacterium]